MTIRVRRFHQHPWNNTIIAYEALDGGRMRYLATTVSREFVHDIIERWGLKAVRTLFLNLKDEMFRKLSAGEGSVVDISDRIEIPPPVARSVEEWERLCGVSDG